AAASYLSDSCQTPRTLRSQISSMACPINHLLVTSSCSFWPTTFPLASVTSSISPYRCTILFLFRAKLSDVVHLKLVLSILVEFKLISKPLLSIWPRLAITKSYPVTEGSVRCTNKSVVDIVYSSTLPCNTLSRIEKSNPTFVEAVLSHCKFVLLIVANSKVVRVLTAPPGVTLR